MTSPSATTAPGLKTPTTSKSSRNGLRSAGLKSNRSNCRFKSMSGSFPHRSSLGQAIGRTGDGQRIAAIQLGDLSLVGMVMNPGDLVGHDGPEQLAVAM